MWTTERNCNRDFWWGDIHLTVIHVKAVVIGLYIAKTLALQGFAILRNHGNQQEEATTDKLFPPAGLYAGMA